LKEDGVTPDLLAMKAAQYAEAKGSHDPKYIKMPQYWLNDECWLEDPQPPKPPAAKGRSKRTTAKTTGGATDGDTSKANGTSTNKRKANAAKTAPKKTKPRRSKGRTKSGKVKLAEFGHNVLRYCDYLDITPRDISLAMGFHQSRIEGACYARKKSSIDMRDKVKSLLIDAVQHRPEDQPLTEEWLREWYDFMIKYEPPKRYKWMAPRRYESPKVC
jgi:hypothetical protein